MQDDDAPDDPPIAGALGPHDRDDAPAEPLIARALDAWTPLAPPVDFADRVLAARDAAASLATGTTRMTGAPGTTGATSMTGTPGTTGAPGTTGTPGVTVTPGMTGAPGTTGTSGMTDTPAAAGARATRASGRRLRWLASAGIAAAAAAAAAALLALRSGHPAAAGSIVADRRITAVLGDRGVAVAEAGGELTWRVDDRGAADVVQRSGDVFYRVEHGGPFVVHTPAGDVRVTGTCFRIEIDAMNNTHKLLLAGAAGAAIASAVLVTVYEGHVIAETRGTKTELSAGAHATLTGDTTTTAADPALTTLADDAHASREQLLVRSREQQAQLLQLRARLAQLERGPAAAAGRSADDADAPEPGRAWHDPSPERLAAWVATCHVRSDEPSLDHFQPGSLLSPERGVAPGEVAAYDAAMAEMAKRWKDLVRSLYVEVTGDSAGADALSSEAMIREIEDKSPPGEHNQLLRKLARERAGLDAPPADLARTSALERLTRAHAELGDQSEAALAKRLGPARASAIRGDGWSSRSESSGCPSDAPAH